MIKRIYGGGNYSLEGNFPYVGTLSYLMGKVLPEMHFVLSGSASKETALIIGADGAVVIRGDIKDVAAIVFHYAAKEFQSGLVTMVINDVIRYHFGRGISIEFVGENKPDFFDELADAVKRFSELNAFS